VGSGEKGRGREWGVVRREGKREKGKRKRTTYYLT